MNTYITTDWGNFSVTLKQKKNTYKTHACNWRQSSENLFVNTKAHFRLVTYNVILKKDGVFPQKKKYNNPQVSVLGYLKINPNYA